MTDAQAFILFVIGLTIIGTCLLFFTGDSKPAKLMTKREYLKHKKKNKD